jgi:hypothetical protein
MRPLFSFFQIAMPLYRILEKRGINALDGTFM